MGVTTSQVAVWPKTLVQRLLMPVKQLLSGLWMLARISGSLQRMLESGWVMPARMLVSGFAVSLTSIINAQELSLRLYLPSVVRPANELAPQAVAFAAAFHRSCPSCAPMRALFEKACVILFFW